MTREPKDRSHALENDNPDIVRLKFFKIERSDGISDPNRPGHATTPVFANGNQRCPISVTIEFADADGTTVPVERQYVIDRLRFINYTDPHEELPIRDLPGYVKDPNLSQTNATKAYIYLDQGEYQWFESAINQNYTLEEDVKILVAKLQKDAKGQVDLRSMRALLDEIAIHQENVKSAKQGNHIEYIPSSSISGYQWPRSHIEKAVLYALAHSATGYQRGYSQTMMADAHRIVTQFRQSNGPQSHIDACTIELDSYVTREVDDHATPYVRCGSHRWHEFEPRAAISQVLSEKFHGDAPYDEKRERHTILYYVAAELKNATTNVAAMINIKEGDFPKQIHTANNHGDNDNGSGDGGGDGKQLFNSSVSVSAKPPPQPAPGQPGFGGSDSYNSLIRHETGTASHVWFSEYFIDLSVSKIPLDLHTPPILTSTLIKANGKKGDREWACASCYQSLDTSMKWSQCVEQQWFLRGTQGNEHGYVKQHCEDCVGARVTNFGTNRALLGHLAGKENWWIHKTQQHKEVVPDHTSTIMEWHDIYGTYHGYYLLMNDQNTITASLYVPPPKT